MARIAGLIMKVIVQRGDNNEVIYVAVGSIGIS